MNMNRRASAAGDAKDFEQLVSSGSRCIGKPRADADGALAEPVLDPPRDLFDLVRRCSLVRTGARRQKGSRVVHDSHSYGDVPDADAVVDEAPRFPLCVPTFDVPRADLELERCRDTIAGLESIGLRCLAVRVKIDKSR